MISFKEKIVNKYFQEPKCREILEFLRDLNQNIFEASLVLYLVFLLLEMIKEGYISFFFNLNILLVVVLISGVIAVLVGKEEVEEETQAQNVTLKDLIFILGLGILGTILVWYKTADLGALSYLLSIISGILIVLLSVITLGGEEEFIALLKNWLKKAPKVVATDEESALQLSPGHGKTRSVRLKSKKRAQRKLMILAVVFFALLGSFFLTKGQNLFQGLFDKTISKPDFVAEEVKSKDAEVSESESKGVVSPIEKPKLGIDEFIDLSGGRVNREKIKVQVLNGNGFQGEAGRINEILKQSGFDVQEPSDAENHDYSTTVIYYKSGQKKAADLVAEEIVADYPATLQENVSPDQEADILVILGQDRIDKSEVKIQVLNGNDIQGEAGRISEILQQSDFDVQEPSDAENHDYLNTIIYYEPEQKDMAELVAEQIADFYSPTLQEDLPDDSEVHIIVILGKDIVGE